MSNHKDSLVKVLEYLVNEDREKASDLLHDVFVEKAKNHWASLSESDESVEDDIQDEDLDETYEVEEGINNYDAEEDFLSDIETAEDEIEAEEVYGEDDHEGEEEMDIDGEEPEMDMDSGEEEAAEPEEALANVEDAIAELRAAFADMMDDEPAEEPEMEEEVAFESDDSDDEVEAVEEAASLSAVSVSHSEGNDTNAKSTVGPGDNSLSNAKPVDISGGTVEAGGKAPAAKDMGVTGPQEAGSPTPAPAPKREMK